MRRNLLKYVIPSAVLVLIAAFAGREIVATTTGAVVRVFSSGSHLVAAADRHRWLLEHPGELRFLALGDFDQMARAGVDGRAELERAVAEVNASGVLGGRKLSVEIRETACDGAVLETEVERAMCDPSVAVLIGPLTRSVIRHYTRLLGISGLVQMLPRTGNARILGSGEHTFCTMESASDEMDSFCEALADRGLNDLMVVSSDDADASLSASEFDNAAHQRGLRVDSLYTLDSVAGGNYTLRMGIRDRFENFGVRNAVVLPGPDAVALKTSVECLLRCGTNVSVAVSTGLPPEALDFVRGEDRRRVFVGTGSGSVKSEVFRTAFRRTVWICASAFARAAGRLSDGGVPTRADMERELVSGSLRTPEGEFSFDAARYAPRRQRLIDSLAELDRRKER